MDGNDDDFPITSPNKFDRGCFNEMNDEFWLQTGNYLLNMFFKQFITIIIS